jgi:hypothetical protein
MIIPGKYRFELVAGYRTLFGRVTGKTLESVNKMRIVTINLCKYKDWKLDLFF